MNKVPFNRPSVIGREFQYLEEALARGELAGDGYFTKQCNSFIAELTKARRALLTHSCTAALEMAAILCDLQPGDEVIMPSFTFVSTANAVALRGGVPVFVDIDRETLNLSPERVAAAVTPRTRAIFAVHYAGFPADMDRLAEIARTHGLWLIEDAAQALGSTYKGRPAGSLGDMGAISFHETKNILSGHGGALTITREDIIERAEIIREKGTNRSLFLKGQVDKYTWVDIGSCFLPGELVAAFLYGQLEQIHRVQKVRLALFECYEKGFRDLESRGRVRLPKAPRDTTGNGHMFYLLLRDVDDRDSFIAHMRASGVATPFHYVPLHSTPAGRRFGRTSGGMEATDTTFATLVRMPMFFTLGPKVERVIEAAVGWLEANG